jgi:hypothetical protein
MKKSSSDRRKKGLGLFSQIKFFKSNKKNIAENVLSRQENTSESISTKSQSRLIIVDGEVLRVRYNHLPTVESCNL